MRVCPVYDLQENLLKTKLGPLHSFKAEVLDTTVNNKLIIQFNPSFYSFFFSELRINDTILYFFVQGLRKNGRDYLFYFPRSIIDNYRFSYYDTVPASSFHDGWIASNYLDRYKTFLEFSGDFLRNTLKYN